MAFLTIDEDRPAEMSSTLAPSFCACLTALFINTVQREPSSTGCLAYRPFSENLLISMPIARAKVWINEPQPDEQASFSIMESIAPFLILKHLMSCPPISIMKSTCGLKCNAALKCATVSTIPKSAFMEFFIKSSP